MELINLRRTTTGNRSRMITDLCGGTFTPKEAYKIGGIGIGGLRYESGLEGLSHLPENAIIRANTEVFRNGLGIYLRHDKENFLLLIPTQRIVNILLHKPLDIVKDTGKFSWFRSLIDRGMSYNYAKMLLLEDEITEVHSPQLKIVSDRLDEINFVIKKRNPLKVHEFFQKSPFSEKYTLDYQEYKMQ